MNTESPTLLTTPPTKRAKYQARNHEIYPVPLTIGKLDRNLIINNIEKITKSHLFRWKIYATDISIVLD